jgi:hypothetical protein
VVVCGVWGGWGGRGKDVERALFSSWCLVDGPFPRALVGGGGEGRALAVA